MRAWLRSSALLTALAADVALADDRPVTAEERTRLEAAVSAAGCQGGRFELDDGHFEVDDARCADGRHYDLKFDASFNLIEKDLED